MSLNSKTFMENFINAVSAMTTAGMIYDKKKDRYLTSQECYNRYGITPSPEGMVLEFEDIDVHLKDKDAAEFFYRHGWEKHVPLKFHNVPSYYPTGGCRCGSAKRHWIERQLKADTVEARERVEMYKARKAKESGRHADAAAMNEKIRQARETRERAAKLAIQEEFRRENGFSWY